MHPRLTTKLTLGATLAACLGFASLAAETPPMPAMPPSHPGGPAEMPHGAMLPPPLVMFKHMDANGDGEVTKAEAMAFAEKRFNELDKNGDGTISAKEILDHILAGQMPPDVDAR